MTVIFCDIAFGLCTTDPRLINHNERTNNNCITITLLSTIVNQQLLIVHLRSWLIKLCSIKPRAITLDLQKLKLVYVVSSNLISVSQNLQSKFVYLNVFCFQCQLYSVPNIYNYRIVFSSIKA